MIEEENPFFGKCNVPLCHIEFEYVPVYLDGKIS